MQRSWAILIACLPLPLSTCSSKARVCAGGLSTTWTHCGDTDGLLDWAQQELQRNISCLKTVCDSQVSYACLHPHTLPFMLFPSTRTAGFSALPPTIPPTTFSFFLKNSCEWLEQVVLWVPNSVNIFRPQMGQAKQTNWSWLPPLLGLYKQRCGVWDEAQWAWQQ